MLLESFFLLNGSTSDDIGRFEVGNNLLLEECEPAARIVISQLS